MTKQLAICLAVLSGAGVVASNSTAFAQATERKATVIRGETKDGREVKTTFSTTESGKTRMTKTFEPKRDAKKEKKEKKR